MERIGEEEIFLIIDNARTYLPLMIMLISFFFPIFHPYPSTFPSNRI